MKTVYLSLGSNVGDREANLQTALRAMPPAGIHVLRVSPIYETEPVEYASQRWFLNLVAETETDLLPLLLLARTSRIERELGRIRAVPKGPRTIDIDILLYENAVVHAPTLEIPHPRMAERRFVLAPLADLVPDLRHPVTHKSIRSLLEAAPPQTIRLLHS
ncbi:MAG TPA: 2-amino-4-hydroxy-6-hydroxymethyldihydropteridine diphosphokinase [Bryobacteraceae bacterium]|nr:2-amino-4-hydroxy-6-hydroxymethyldihydropteridine diphosphokinase [Bryobacteraceae bacterium]